MPDTNEQSRQLGSAEDLRVEHLLDELRCTTAALTVSLKSLQKSPDNAVFRACAAQQAQECREELGSLLRSDRVVYADEIAAEVLPQVEPLLGSCARAEPEAGAPALTALFQAVADEVLEANRIEKAGRPCAALLGFLASRATLPEVPAEPEAPAVPAPEVPAEPELLHETTFMHGEGAAKDHLGRTYLALLIHQRGLTLEEAQKHIHAQALVGFDRSIEKVLGDYRGRVAFRLVRYPDGVRSELRRIAPPKQGNGESPGTPRANGGAGAPLSAAARPPITVRPAVPMAARPAQALAT